MIYIYNKHSLSLSNTSLLVTCYALPSHREGLFQTMTNKELCLDKKGMPIA